MADSALVVSHTAYDEPVIPLTPEELLAYCEHQIEQGVAEEETGRNRVAINTHRIATHSLYLLYINERGDRLYPDMNSYLNGRGQKLGIARSTFFKHHKTLKILEWAGIDPDEVAGLGDGIPSLHNVKSLALSAADIDRVTGAILNLNPTADKTLEEYVPGGSVRDKVKAAVEHLIFAREQLVSVEEPEPKLPRDEVVNWLRHDLGGKRIIKPICRTLPSGLRDFGWFVEDTGEVGWFSEDVPPEDVWEWYLSKTGAVER